MIETAMRSSVLVFSRDTDKDSPTSTGQSLLHQLIADSLVHAEDWERLAFSDRANLTHLDTPTELLPALVERGLLTEYQALRIQAGRLFGLRLGNYRVLDRLGAGAMGVVFKGEHIELRRQVAIKVLPLSGEHDPRLLLRFTTEMRAVAQLQHPNIVCALDAGRCVGADPSCPVLHYFVMEYAPGEDLEAHIKEQGPLPLTKACDLIHQVGSALAEAHRHHLVHRDIKPSNIQVTPEGQAKLLDFGLTRHLSNRLTEPGTILGTVDFMAPEQARDPGSVDIRADIYGLGGTLFWCLTGQLPFLPKGNISLELIERLTQSPPSLRKFRPELPAEVDDVVARMMARDPAHRFATPQAVMNALVPFLRAEVGDHFPNSRKADSRDMHAYSKLRGPNQGEPIHRLLLVGLDPTVRKRCAMALSSSGIQCDEATQGLDEGRAACKSAPYDLILIDADVPCPKKCDVCRQMRKESLLPHSKIIMVLDQSKSDEFLQIELAGADDYLCKPIDLVNLHSRVQTALRLKDAQDRADSFGHHLLALNHELEIGLSARDSDLVQARNALVLALVEMVSYRDSETAGHLMRLQRYCRLLAEEATREPVFAAQIDSSFIDMLECCAPLHDIGKVGLPDHILQKPGKLTPEERIIMQTHTTIGADTLSKVAKQHGFARAFFDMAIDIARHHHERFDGKGYPDRLAADSIPLAARVVTIADVYDALRSRRVYKPALSHTTAVHMMVEEFQGSFDPALVPVFRRCTLGFDQIFSDHAD
jgi:response regulator RpfG family c-di-GMP phosphodiesterase